MFLFQGIGRSKITILREYVAIKNMATIMEDMNKFGEPTTPENLNNRGFSSEDISRYGLKAAHRARKRATNLVTV
ncbi:hypothetical protein DFR47_11610 [Pseudochrobactrum asaccharolyticum]|uniref:Uncharacterized protein n=1 Tax=Pseudochrobactrum asaccharolyticum TaxID=354351 RepID=A0A366DGT2_9HYPH|nr:hypothetical protein DFR47_11610 [Pseudochrobactrum asaccharolyticum]